MNRFNEYVLRFNRIAAWVLLVSVFVYIITGYGMTKGIIDYSIAHDIHSVYLPIVLLVAFVIHTYNAFRFSLKRSGNLNSFSSIVLASVYVIFFAWSAYLFFLPTPTTNSQINTDQNLNTQAEISTTKVFAKSELAKYTGKNGQPAYVAINGIVYDLSSVFINGVHSGYSAGQDLTVYFNSQHSTDILGGFPVVGKLQ